MRYLPFKFELLHSFLKPTLKVVGSTPGLLRVDTSIYLPGLFLKFECFRAMVPVINLLRQAVFNRCAGLIYPFKAPTADFL